MKNKKFLFVLSAISHLVVIFILFFLFLPFAKWYFDKRPALGIDLYNTATYVSYLAKNFSLPFSSWKYIWYAGNPLFIDYPTLYFYLILPLVKFFGTVQAIQLFCLGATFVFFVFSYLLFSQLSSSRLLALVLTIGAMFSVGIYGSLIIGGSLPYYISQAFMPIILLCVVLYNKSGNFRVLVLAGIFTAVSVLGHSQATLGLTVPLALILILCWQQEDKPFFAKKKLIAVLIFGVVSFFASLPVSYAYVVDAPKLVLRILTIGSTITQNPTSEPTYNKSLELNQLYKIQSWSHSVFFILFPIILGLFLLAVIFSKKIRLHAGQFFAAITASVFGFLFLFTFALRLNPFHGGWYRAFWFVPIILGLNISILWGGFSVFLKERFPKIMSFGFKGLITILVFLIAVLVIIQEAGLREFKFSLGNFGVLKSLPQKLFEPFSTKLIFVAIPSSAFPDVLNNNLTREEQEKIYNQLKPSWFDTKEKNYRFYSADAEVNIWWNSLYETPLARGYIDPIAAGPKSMGFLFLVGSSLNNNELTKIFKYPLDVARNYGLFFLDWVSIKYLESPDDNPSGRYYLNPLSEYIRSPDVIARDARLDFNTQNYEGEGLYMSKITNLKESVHYYQVKDNVVSPILSTTNAKTLCIVSNDEGYNLVLRILAMRNLNSQIVIPIHCSDSVSGLKYQELKDFDEVLLYNYKSGSRGSWNELKKFVEHGGRLIIDVGGETKEANSDNLPDVFPISKTVRKSLGQNWEFSISEDSAFAKDIAFEKFDPAKEDDKPWNLSFPESSKDIRSWAKPVLLSWGHPLIFEGDLGKGKVIFSGINLPYHLLRKQNMDEAIFFERFLNLPKEPQEKPNFWIKWVSAEKREISGQNATGVLFKEHGFDGWDAKISAAGKTENLKIYKAGPRIPGFIYVKIPKNLQNSQFKVTFQYRGLLFGKFTFLVSFLAIILSLDFIFLGKRGACIYLAKKFNNFSRRARKKVLTWWEHEEF